MKVVVIAAALASTIVATAPAQADEGQISRDIRCFSLLGPAASRMIRDSNPRVRAQGSKAVQAASYYIGRVDAMVPPADLAERMRRELAALKDADSRAESARCLREMQAIEKRFDALGADLKASLPAN